MYRASSPFFEGDKGDRRVSAFQSHEIAATLLALTFPEAPAMEVTA
jgi:hypothetical protein